MSTLKTHNLQSPDAGSVNILMTPNAGMIVTGISTFSGQIDVGSNIKLGNAGVVTATSFVGSGANLTSLPAQATIANNADNRVITGGSGVNLNGEANLTFDGTTLTVSGNASANAVQSSFGGITTRLGFVSGSAEGVVETTSNHSLVLGVNSNEKLRIDTSGRVIIGATSTIGNTYSNNFTVSEASGNVGMQFAGNNSTSNYASIYFGDAGHRQRHFLESQLGTNGNFTIGTIGTGPIRFTNSGGERFRIAGTGKIGINNNSPGHPLHIVNTSSTFNSASLIKGDTSTSGGGAYATFTNTADSKSAYFGVDGNGLFNLDAGAALVGTNGDESIIFATNGNDMKVRIFGGTDNVIQLKGGNNLSISDFAPNQTFSGTYNGWHVDNHGNTLIGLNSHLNYSSNSGTHQWKQTNAHSTIGSAGMFIGGNGSNNNTNICFFRNSQGASAGQTYAQDSWKFQIGSALTVNHDLRFLQRGYFKCDTSNSNANNAPTLATNMGYSFGYQEAYSTSNGAWTNPYPDLVLGYHTGVSFGGHPNYNGCRFFSDHPSSSSSVILNVGNGGNGVNVPHSLSKGGGSFRIRHPHPSKKYTHDLQHSFIEGPQCDNIYRGKVSLTSGSATINLDTVSNMTDGTFVLLNRDIQCFTSNETGWGAVKGSVSGNVLTITAQDNSSTDTISWMVIGERQDDKIKSIDMDITDADGKLITEPLTIESSHM